MSATPVLAPVKGRAVPMEQVPDPVFAQLMTGPGAAVDPAREVLDVVAPVSGKLFKLYPHAFVVLTPDGVAVLVHLGIDTVQLKGEGFRLLASEGERVRAGQPVVAWDPAAIEAGGRSPVCPVVALEAVPGTVSPVVAAGPVRAGDELLQWD
jgi:sugar PTS system EIIA component